jgi:3-hydroxymyristoyl/3-hydroxydecanoyl-(acyl carrier protein) dehydratase
MTMRSSIAAARISGPQLEANGTALFEFQFSAGDPTFAGHFPTQPILPGVFQLEIARAAAQWVLNCPLRVGGVSKAKFLRPISPGEPVRVELKLSEKDGAIQARAGFSIYGQPAGETLLLLWRNE